MRAGPQNTLKLIKNTELLMATKHRYGLILAGGRGTRFWPRSRKRTPKQLLPVVGETSLIRQTVDRLRPLIPPERIWILTNELLRRSVIKHLPEVPPQQVIAEPEARNTAPAIGLAAQVIHTLDPEAVLGIFPSDHYIDRPGKFRRLARAAFRGAEDGKLMVMGIQPRWPETGYGYLEFPKGVTPGATEVAQVRRFCEKPDIKRAKRFVAAGRFFWNAGMFFWRADVILASLRKHLPKTTTLLASLPPITSRKFKTSLSEVFPHTENISIDYAVMERSHNVGGIAADDIGWNDLGSWQAAYELMAGEPGGNVARTDALLISSNGNFIDVPGKLVTTLGVDDLVVVETPDALLIIDRKNAQHVADVVKVLEKLGRVDLL
jgi:mannose-1-phosphate guanylyltransferase